MEIRPADSLEVIRGTDFDPKLPASSLDGILVVDAFHEFTNKDAMLTGFLRALKPGGRLGVIDHTAGLGLKPADYMERHMIPQESVIEQAARSGLRLRSFDADFAGAPGESHYYFVVFEKPK